VPLLEIREDVACSLFHAVHMLLLLSFMMKMNKCNKNVVQTVSSDATGVKGVKVWLGLQSFENASCRYVRSVFWPPQ